ncbi:type I inositol polyphosphate 5-phosphatase 8-like [Aristolochia californica]|uniref:type I inositol polyphosphate 5-phosphatase 8-like n=1 Tax=Aristolochia californica TaxID=171875 RepID=UPI0035E0C28E
MRTNHSGQQKSSWSKTVVRKWLNIRNRADEFHCDYTVKEQRRKSCSDKDRYVYLNEDISAWLTGGVPEILKRPHSDPDLPATSATENLRMFVGTWNVGGKAPHGGLNLKDWLGTPNPADIYVLGFQEIVPLNAGNVLGAEDRGPAAKWLSLIHNALNSSHKMDPTFTQNNRRAPLPPEFPLPCDRQQSQKPRVCFSDLLSFDDDELEEEYEDFSGELDSGTDCFGSHKHGERGNYCVVASKQMVGLFLCVWVRRDLCRHICNLKVSCVGRGIMGYLGNKGSISISMTLNQATFCFVCTHLASGEKEGDQIRRNSDVMEILKKTRFPSSSRLPGVTFSPEFILDHDKIIWLGDLNYRLASGVGDTHGLLQKNDWQALLEKDQLRIEQRAGRVFKGWEEGRICFAPTYKYIANSDRYVVELSKSREKRRTPAWCDRILWRGEGLKQMYYVRGESKFSDHRPVYSLFSVHIEVAVAPLPQPSAAGKENNEESKIRKSYTAHCYISNARVEAEEQLLRQEQLHRQQKQGNHPLHHLQSSRF